MKFLNSLFKKNNIQPLKPRSLAIVFGERNGEGSLSIINPEKVHIECDLDPLVGDDIVIPNARSYLAAYDGNVRGKVISRTQLPGSNQLEVWVATPPKFLGH